MANTSAKARNSDRKHGKAWSKNHGVVKTRPAPSAEKVARREAKAAAGSVGGAPITMPKISWEWASKVMSSRWPNTRKVRSLDAYLAWEKASPARKDDVLAASSVSVGLEPKPGGKPSRKSVARAEAAARKDGR